MRKVFARYYLVDHLTPDEPLLLNARQTARCVVELDRVLWRSCAQPLPFTLEWSYDKCVYHYESYDIWEVYSE